MRKRVLRYLLAGLGTGIAGAGALVFVLMRPAPATVASPVETAPMSVFGLGTVEAKILSKVGFEVGAALVDIRVDQGDRVKAGDILARLQNADQEARVSKAEAGVLNAEAAVKRAEAAVGKARSVLAQKKQANLRKQALLARQTVSLEAAEAAQMEADVAAGDLAVAIGDVDVAKAALEDAKAQHALETVLLGHRVLKAPYDALVVQRHKELGSVLSAGEPVFTLVAPETVWALAYVDEAQAGNIRVGQPAEIRLRSLPDQTFEGTVARIDIESDRVSEERRVYVACNRCPERFHLGEQAEIYVTTTAVADDAPLAPKIAAKDKAVDGLPAGARVATALRPGLREGRPSRQAEEASK